jgi:4,5-DOPA dioxygenase extradiol
VPRPRVILVISAHWYINSTAVTAMVRPRTIHDFYGFPRALFDVEYPAPGLPELSEQIADVVHPMWVGRDLDSWGIDHGTWSVLVHAFPDASIPVVQLSLNAEKDLDYHLALGQKLAALRREGVLMVGSGNIVHNLGAVDFSRPESAYDWAQRFDDHAREILLSQPTNVTSLDADRDFRLAVPTPDHFLPLLYLAGIATDSSQELTALVDGHAAGSISMASYTLGVDCPTAGDLAGQPAAPLPTGVPADETNL